MTPVRLTWRGRFAVAVAVGLLAALLDPLAHGVVGAAVWAGQAGGLVP